MHQRTATSATRGRRTRAENTRTISADLLSLRKYTQGTIEYPDKQGGRHTEPGWFGQHGNEPLGALGVFDAGSQGVAPARAATIAVDTAPIAEAAGPIGDPPAVNTKAGEEAAWLKRLFADQMELVTASGKVMRRPATGYQGRRERLQPGHWFILSGTRSVKPAR